MMSKGILSLLLNFSFCIDDTQGYSMCGENVGVSTHMTEVESPGEENEDLNGGEDDRKNGRGEYAAPHILQRFTPALATRLSPVAGFSRGAFVKILPFFGVRQELSDLAKRICCGGHLILIPVYDKGARRAITSASPQVVSLYSCPRVGREGVPG
jgi:hypothetical protein